MLEKIVVTGSVTRCPGCREPTGGLDPTVVQLKKNQVEQFRSIGGTPDHLLTERIPSSLPS